MANNTINVADTIKAVVAQVNEQPIKVVSVMKNFMQACRAVNDARDPVWLEPSDFKRLGVRFNLKLSNDACVLTFNMNKFFPNNHMGLVAGEKGSVFNSITFRTCMKYIYHFRDEQMVYIVTQRVPEETIENFTSNAPFYAMLAMVLVVQHAVRVQRDKSFLVPSAPGVARTPVRMESSASTSSSS